jgi:hypothetical protein
MALTETTIVDQTTVLENGVLEVRETTTIYKNGEEVSKTYTRFTFSPGDDVSAMPQLVQDIAALAWTPQVIAAFQAQRAENLTVGP